MMEREKVSHSTRGTTQFHHLLIKNLKAYRKKRGYSQMKLAHLCSVSPNYIGEIEMGRKFPSADTMDKIIFALNLKPYQLFFSEEDVAGVESILENRYDQMQSELAQHLMETLRVYSPSALQDKSEALPKDLSEKRVKKYPKSDLDKN
jgi:transcriptional regulator with XRE-family HTH domain